MHGASCMPHAVKQIISQPAPSSLADDLLCPAVREFEPCANNAHCRERLKRSIFLLDCLRLCQQRATLRERRASQACDTTDAFASAHSAGFEMDPSTVNTHDPYFSGGFGEARHEQSSSSGRAEA